VFSEAIPAGCVLVDGVSTGRSVAALLQRIGSAGRVFSTLLFLDHLLDAQAVSESSVQWAFRSSDFGGRHFPLEWLLQSPYPPVAVMAADAASGGLVKAYGQTELSAPEARMVQAKSEVVTAFTRAIRLRGLGLLTEAQNQALMRAALDAILGSSLAPAMFPSFIAREKFAPF